MKEIGGYLELERFGGQEYYPDLFKFNLGRTAITWYLKETGVKRVYLPDFLCGSVIDAVKALPVEVRIYPIGEDFLPEAAALPEGPLREDECLFVLNAYGQLSDSAVLMLKEKYGRILYDFTHAFFQQPPEGVAAVASLRKFFGLTDGAYLKSDRPIAMPGASDSSSSRFAHVLGRFEKPAGEFYQAMLDTAHGYEHAEALRMSPLTENLLRGIDYDTAASRRMANYLALHERLEGQNGLVSAGHLRTPDVGPFVYPLLVPEGMRIRRELAKKSIFVPTYWNNVMAETEEGTTAHIYAADILPLPCDQRYTPEDMAHVAEEVQKLL